MLRAGMITKLFVRIVSTVINAITNGRIQRAIFIRALELARSADPFRAVRVLIRSILAVFLAIAHPMMRNTPVILALRTAPMLEFGAIGNASSPVRSQNKVIWAFASRFHTLQIRSRSD